MKSILWPLVLVVIWLGLITTLSTTLGSYSNSQALIVFVLESVHLDWVQTLSAERLSAINFLLRKLAHFSEYAVLFGIAYWLARRGIKLSKAIAIPLVLGSVIVFAGSDEIHQSFVPGRTPQVRDVLIDSSGATAAACIALKVDRPGE